MKRYEITNDYGCGYGVTPEEKTDGEWVKYEDVEKIIVKLTQLKDEWNSTSLVPINRSELKVVLSNGDHRLAGYNNNSWYKLAGDPQDNFTGDDIIKWSYYGYLSD